VSAKGNMGLNGSFDLTTSKLTLEERIEVITNGRNTMMPYKTVLKENEIKEVAEYVETLVFPMEHVPLKSIVSDLGYSKFCIKI